LLLAEGLLREALAIDPDFVNAHAALCRKQLAAYRISRDAARFGAAEEACHRVLEDDAESADVRTVLGQLYLASGKYENALHEFERALEDNGHLPESYVGLARTQAALGRTEEAEANLRLAIETDVSYWASFNAMGNFLFEQARFDEAAEFYQMYVNRVDDDALALNNLGAAYYLAGDFRQAAQAWDDSLAIKPTRSAYSNTGTMYFYLGDFERAIERYVNAANLAPNDHRVWGNLADAYYFDGGQEQVADVAYRRAIDLAEQSLEVNAEEFLVMSEIALYYSRIGNTEKAKEFIVKAQSQGGGIMYVHYNTALMHVQLGNTDEAIASLERAVELNYQPELLTVDPALAGLRKDERFRRLLAKNNS
jgi:tetratricopeptide (TPR) repeat protein